MHYHINKNDTKLDTLELQIVRNYMIELSENSEKYKVGNIFGGNVPALYGDWLLEIVNKRLELNPGNNINYIEYVDTIFNWFVNSEFPCDFTRTYKEGHNVFHKISYGGFLNYFQVIFDMYKDRSAKNMYDALTKKGAHYEIKGETPFEVVSAYEKERSSMECYSKLHSSMKDALVYLENKI